MDEILYGAAYYDEYMPEERLAKDVALLKKAGMNVVRIGESTWSTYEPQPGRFDFSHLRRVLDAMGEAGIHVIVGTPTYAIPTWLARLEPDVLALTHDGQELYGRRQNMDITHPGYRFYAERIIREQMKVAAPHPAVIGFQIDNETKPYDACTPRVQKMFVRHLRELFHDDLDALNQAWGLDYWSNRVNAWEDFPDVRGTINASLAAEFERFQRSLVEEFFRWQRGIIDEYRRPGQFVTHNFDFSWREGSYGIQTETEHRRCGRFVDVAGGDIYHPSQDRLTGYRAAFCGSILRSIKRDNYLILETEAQGFCNWTPFPGQLALQAYAHIANGADMVEYWHWHSLHNACETYWKGVLGHDFKENAVYREACQVGAELRRFGDRLLHLKKKNAVAVLASNAAASALKRFPVDGREMRYNEVMTIFTEALYRMNVEFDIVWPDLEGLDEYRAVVVPALYAASEETLEGLKRYAENGGTLLVTFKSGYADEAAKVYHDAFPHVLHEALGASYSLIANPPVGCGLRDPEGVFRAASLEGIMEMVETAGARALATYDHYAWENYAALTENPCGRGRAYYLGCLPDPTSLTAILRRVLAGAGVEYESEASFPLIIRKGVNRHGRVVRFYFNFSAAPLAAPYRHPAATSLTDGAAVAPGDVLSLPRWGYRILEEK